MSLSIIDFFDYTCLFSVANLVEELIRDANSRQYQYVLIGLLSLKIIIYYGMAIVSLEKALLVSRPMRWDIKFGLFVETKMSSKICRISQ